MHNGKIVPGVAQNDSCPRLPLRAQIGDYRRWIDTRCKNRLQHNVVTRSLFKPDIRQKELFITQFQYVDWSRSFFDDVIVWKWTQEFLAWVHLFKYPHAWDTGCYLA